MRDVERTTLRSTASKSDRLSQASVAMKVGASECRGDGIAAGIGTQGHFTSFDPIVPNQVGVRCVTGDRAGPGHGDAQKSAPA